mmetsp:Transcript_45298/g.145202  ORF Transcript_45298/g.145202 Transcript_45298/m.145202 type:complete len:225 (-) Transcript_45298:953-1627(-)
MPSGVGPISKGHTPTLKFDQRSADPAGWTLQPSVYRPGLQQCQGHLMPILSRSKTRTARSTCSTLRRLMSQGSAWRALRWCIPRRRRRRCPCSSAARTPTRSSRPCTEGRTFSALTPCIKSQSWECRSPMHQRQCFQALGPRRQYLGAFSLKVRRVRLCPAASRRPLVVQAAACPLGSQWLWALKWPVEWLPVMVRRLTWKRRSNSSGVGYRRSRRRRQMLPRR